MPKMAENKVLPMGLTCHLKRESACARLCQGIAIHVRTTIAISADGVGGLDAHVPTLVLVMRNLLFMPAAQLLRTKPCTKELLALSAAAVHATESHVVGWREKPYASQGG